MCLNPTTNVKLVFIDNTSISELSNEVKIKNKKVVNSLCWLLWIKCYKTKVRIKIYIFDKFKKYNLIYIAAACEKHCKVRIGFIWQNLIRISGVHNHFKSAYVEICLNNCKIFFNLSQMSIRTMIIECINIFNTCENVSLLLLVFVFYILFQYKIFAIIIIY